MRFVFCFRVWRSVLIWAFDWGFILFNIYVCFVYCVVFICLRVWRLVLIWASDWRLVLFNMQVASSVLCFLFARLAVGFDVGGLIWAVDFVSGG